MSVVKARIESLYPSIPEICITKCQITYNTGGHGVSKTICMLKTWNPGDLDPHAGATLSIGVGKMWGEQAS